MDVYRNKFLLAVVKCGHYVQKVVLVQEEVKLDEDKDNSFPDFRVWVVDVLRMVRGLKSARMGVLRWFLGCRVTFER